MPTRGLARFHRRNAPPAGPQGRSHLRPLDPRRYCTRRAASVPRGAARSGPGDQPAPLGAALQTVGPVEGLTAAAARRTRKPWALSIALLHGQTPLPGWQTWGPGHSQGGAAALRTATPATPRGLLGPGTP